MGLTLTLNSTGIATPALAQTGIQEVRLVEGSQVQVEGGREPVMIMDLTR